MTEPIAILTQIKDAIKKSSNIVVVLPNIVNVDSCGSALAMTLAIQKMGKSVTISSSADLSSITLEQKNLIRSSIVASGDELLISFPYTDGAVEKVSYNIDEKNNRFNLVIAPYKGYPRLSTNDLKYEFVGGKADLIIVFDSPALTSLGELHSKNTGFFQGVEMINIDRHFNNGTYGTINLVNKQSSSLAEMTYEIIHNLEVEIDSDIATNLLQALMQATKNLTAYTVTPSSLELAATLMRFGGKKAPTPAQNPTNSLQSISQRPNSPMNPFGGGFGASAGRGGMSPMDPMSGFDDFGDFSDLGQDTDFGQLPQFDSMGAMSNDPYAPLDSYSDPYMPLSMPTTSMPNVPTNTPSFPTPTNQTMSTNIPTIPNVSSLEDSTRPTLNTAVNISSTNANSTPITIPDSPTEESLMQNSDEAPDDWLKPKIFRPPTSPSPSGMTS